MIGYISCFDDCNQSHLPKTNNQKGTLSLANIILTLIYGHSKSMQTVGQAFINFKLSMIYITLTKLYVRAMHIYV